MAMGEYNEQTKRPNLYEQFAPELRFAMIAKSILEKTSKSSDNEDVQAPVVAVWPQKPDGYHYKLQAKAVYEMGPIPTYYFSLEHHLTGLPADKPMTKYVVSVSANGIISKISIFNSQGVSKKLSPEGRVEATLELLSILTDAAPVEAKEILADAFHRRYESAVGAYVLSNLAIAGQEGDINELNATVQAEAFEERVIAIQDKVLRQSQKKDSPAKQSFIEEAVMTRRGPTNMNEYRTIDVPTIAKRIAKEVLIQNGRKWKHTVTPEQ
jgi:hypothetical protein